MQNHNENDAEFNVNSRGNEDRTDKAINKNSPKTVEDSFFQKMLEESREGEKSKQNPSFKQISIKKEEEFSDKDKNTPIYIVVILVLSMICGLLVGMYFDQKQQNHNLISKINEQSQQIYDYKFGTLP